MNIMIGCSSPPDKGSGILTYSVEITRGFLSMGHRVYFVSPPPAQEHQLAGCEDVVLVSTTQHDDVQAITSEIYGLIEEQAIDFVINNDNPIVQNVAPFISVPFLSVGHLGIKSIASLACYQHEWSDYVISISNDMHRAFTGRFGVPSFKCPIIYNGISDDEAGVVVKHSSCDSDLKVVYAGGMNKMKGGDIISTMVSRDGAAWKNVNLSWYGELPEVALSRHRQQSHVQLMGKVPRDNFIAALSSADVLLFPSREEGCPMAIIEAKKYGVVPIVSDGTGAMRTMVTSGIDGFTCYLDSWSDQAMECLKQLAKDRNILNTIKDASRASYEQSFTIEIVVKKLLNLAANPTVDREVKSTTAQLVKWHRPLRPDGKKSPFVDRILYRLGILRKCSGQARLSGGE